LRRRVLRRKAAARALPSCRCRRCGRASRECRHRFGRAGFALALPVRRRRYARLAPAGKASRVAGLAAGVRLDLRNKRSYFRTMNTVPAFSDGFGARQVRSISGILLPQIGDAKKLGNMSPVAGFCASDQRFKIGCTNWRRLPDVAYFPWRGTAKPATQARPCAVEAGKGDTCAIAPRQLGEP